MSVGCAVDLIFLRREGGREGGVCSRQGGREGQRGTWGCLVDKDGRHREREWGDAVDTGGREGERVGCAVDKEGGWMCTVYPHTSFEVQCLTWQ